MSITIGSHYRSASLMQKLMAQGEADVTAGKTVLQERVFEELRWRLTVADDRPR